MSSLDFSEFGPLPISDDNAVLQRESFVALNRALPADRFILRDERVEDYGVDASLELLIGGAATNLRGQIQLKGTQQPQRNGDGTITYSIRVKNLNYLLNGHSPLYIVWDKSHNELWWAWAREEMNRIERSTPDWQKQKKVTLHFRNRLNDSALDIIKERICHESRMHRRTLEYIGRQSLLSPQTESSEGVRLWVQHEDLKVLDPQELAQALLHNGERRIIAGDAKNVLEDIEKLDVAIAKKPSIQLLAAHAYFNLGRYDGCASALTQTLVRLDDIDEQEKEFALFLRDVTHFSQGRLSLDEYQRRLENREQSNNLYVNMHGLDVARMSYRGVADSARRKQLLGKAIQLALSQEQDSTLPKEAQIWARLATLEMVGEHLSMQAIEAFFRNKIFLELGEPLDLQSTSAGLQPQFLQWRSKIEQTLSDELVQNHPILKGQALFVRAVLETNILMQGKIAQAVIGFSTNLQEDELLEKARLQAMNDAEEARTILQQAGHTENELLAALQLCQLFELTGQDEAVKRMASTVEVQGDALGLESITQHARLYLEGNSPLKKLERNIALMKSTSRDERYAAMSDDDIRATASQMLHMYRLPNDRLPNIEMATFCVREIARERCTWCSHLGQRENSGRENPETHFAEEPIRVIVCSKHDWSSFPSQGNWKAQIADFKTQYCLDCKDRKPLKGK